MVFNLSMTVWNEAEAIVKAQGVRKVSRKDLESREVLLSGHIKSSFGFIHHPKIKYHPADKQVTAFDCDCWNNMDGNVFCSHCAALLASEYEEREISVNATVEENKKLRFSSSRERASASASLASDRVTVIDDRINRVGNRIVSGKSISSFGFVHHPQITFSGTRMIDYTCDCYHIVESRKVCPHCEILNNLLSSPEPERKEDAAESDQDDSVGEDVLLEKDFLFPQSEEVREPSNRVGQGEPTAGDAIAERNDLQPDGSDEEPVPLFHEMESDKLMFEAMFAENDGKEEPVPSSSIPETLPESMEIVFGYDRETETPVVWRPNDTEQLVHVNTGIIGTMGTGKTQFAKSLVTQLYRQQNRNFDGSPLGILIFDYKGDYNQSKSDFVQATDARVLELYHLPYNPFSLRGLKKKPQLPYHTASEFAGILTKIYRLGSVQYNTLLHCIITAYEQMGITGDPATWENTAPTFDMVYQVYMKSNVKQDALFSAMYALAQFEIFEKDPEKTTSLFDLLNGTVVLDLSGYDARIQNLTVAITLELFCSQMLNSGSSRWNAQYRQLTRIILVDEADHIMSEGFPALKRILKEGREFGVGTILSTQSLKHFGSGDEDYAGYILTWIVHAVSDFKRTDADFIFKTSGFHSEGLLQEIALQKKNESIVKIGNAEPVRMMDLPFWKMSEDADQSYLRFSEEEKEETISYEIDPLWPDPMSESKEEAE